MFYLEKYFAEIDKIDNIDELIEMRQALKDSSYTKMFWEQRKIALTGEKDEIRLKARIKCSLIAKKYCACIAVSKKVNPFTAPHGFAGIHISIDASIGKGCTLFQHVVIGSNTMPDSKCHGFPVIGDNVYIGAGAMVIGNVHIGNNVRIGANCIVTKDVPDNCVVVGPKSIIIQREELMNNKFINADQYKKMVKEGLVNNI